MLYVLLRQHATRRQFTPNQLRAMHRDDLGYLAGTTTPNPLQLENTSAEDTEHPLSPAEQEIKVVENAERAKRELERRTSFWGPVIAALIGASVGGAVALIALI